VAWERPVFFLKEAWVLPKVEVAGRADQQVAATVVERLLAEARSRGELAEVDVEAASRILLGAYAEAVLHILATGEAAPSLDVLDLMVDSLVSDKQQEKRCRQ
jgi:hypothetical protein